MIESIAAGDPGALAPHRPKPTAVTPGLTEATSTLWSAVVGSGEAGFWECTAGEFTARRDGYTEVCHLLEGDVTVETEGGGSVRLGAGDSLVMPSGWVGRWIVHAPVRKLYVIVPDQPAS